MFNKEDWGQVLRQGLKGEKVNEVLDGYEVVADEGSVTVKGILGVATMSYDEPPKVEGLMEKALLDMMRRARASVRDKMYQQRCKNGLSKPRGGIVMAKVIRISADMTEEEVIALLRKQKSQRQEAYEARLAQLQAAVEKARAQLEKAEAALEAFTVEA